MDRRKTVRGPLPLAGLGLGLGLALTTTGCRHTRPEVPPERPYAPMSSGTSLSPAPSIGFSSEPATSPYGGAFGPGGTSNVPPGMNTPPRGVMGEPGAPPSPL